MMASRSCNSVIKRNNSGGTVSGMACRCYPAAPVGWNHGWGLLVFLQCVSECRSVLYT